ncbi:MAG: hypothetical protein ABI747_00500 [Candidatus Moraniibacteriota bacterium]
MATIVRITRHPADPSRIEALRKAFGNDLKIVDDDVPYSDDPVKAVAGLLEKYGDVVAIEVVAPVPVLAKLTAAKREFGNLLILRAEFARGTDGRVVVTSQDAHGRDVFGFGHYEVIEQVLVKTRPLISPV